MSSFPWLLALLVAVGGALRWIGLGEALPMDDEVHGLRLMAAEPAAALWFRYGAADPCWPLALWGELGTHLMTRGGAGAWGLPALELWLRAPVAAASTLALGVLPRRARAIAGAGPALIFAALLALSPLLVLFGRVARPYGILALTVPAVVLLLVEWSRDPSPRRLVGLGGLVALSAALSPLVLPALLAPVLLAGGLHGFRGVDRPAAGRWRAVAKLWLTCAGAGLLALGPALGDLLALARDKAVASPPPPVGSVARLLTGVAASAPPWLAGSVPWLLGALALAGLGGLLGGRLGRHLDGRRDPSGRRLGVLMLAAILAQGIALAGLAPLGWHNPLIAARYLLPVLPLGLLAAAVGLAALAGGWPRAASSAAPAARWRSRPLASGLAVVWVGAPLALVVASGVGTLAAPGGASFRTHNDLLRFERPPAYIEATDLPPALAILDDAAPGALLQLPLRHEGHFSRAPYAWASHHRRPVLAAGLETFPCAEGFALGRVLCPAPRDLARAPARYLVLVLDPRGEEARVRGLTRPRDPRPRRWQAMARLAQRLRGQLEAQWGPPIAADERILIWDLGAAGGSVPAPSPPARDRLDGS